MKFIDTILPFFAAAACLLSCNKVADSGAPVIDGGRPICLVVGVGDGSATKATGVVSNSDQGESKVNNLQVFVFNGDVLDGYGSSSSKTATVACSSGERQIYCVVNEPSLSSVTTKSALLASVARLSESPSSFGMMGSKTETLEADGNVIVEVKRFASRVVVKGIKNALQNEAQAASFRLDAVYLTNAAGDVDYALSYDASTGRYVAENWYNRKGYEANNNLGSFTYDAVGSVVAAGATNSTAHYFYTMPNAMDVTVGGEPYTPRRCVLVIKATIDGVVNYYPIRMPVIDSNKSYEINLVNITRPGNPEGSPDAEERPVEGFDQGFEIEVADWTVVLVGDQDGNITI